MREKEGNSQCEGKGGNFWFEGKGGEFSVRGPCASVGSSVESSNHFQVKTGMPGNDEGGITMKLVKSY